MTHALIETIDLRASYGGTEILHGIDLALEYGECVAIIGPNGCGKSTLIHVLAGLKDAAGGRILVDGMDVTRSNASQRLLMGVAIVPQGRRVFPQMTVRENLLMGSYLRPREARGRLDAVVPLLGAIRNQLPAPCGTLSGGLQQLVSIGRALMSTPRLLLLDEPFLGLSAANQTLVLQTIRALSAHGTTMAIIEHRINVLNEVIGRAVAMNQGRISEFADLAAWIAGTERTPEIGRDV